MDPELLPLDAVVARCAAALRESGAGYALIGAVAVGARGYVRTTADVDFLLHIERIRVPALLDRLAALGASFDPARTLRHLSDREIAAVRFQDVQIDFVPAVLPYFHEILRRATNESICGAAVRTATAEDLVVLKLLADRTQDRADIEGLLAAGGPGLDSAYVLDRVRTLLPAGDPRIAGFERRARPGASGDSRCAP